ncbi:hypothetical protein D3C87_1837990 [compost metagenome]
MISRLSALTMRAGGSKNSDKSRFVVMPVSRRTLLVSTCTFWPRNQRVDGISPPAARASQFGASRMERWARAAA